MDNATDSPPVRLESHRICRTMLKNSTALRGLERKDSVVGARRLAAHWLAISILFAVQAFAISALIRTMKSDVVHLPMGHPAVKGTGRCPFAGAAQLYQGALGLLPLRAMLVSNSSMPIVLLKLLLLCAFIGQSMFVAHLFNGFHEMSHNTVFSPRWLNAVFGHLTGFLILRPRRHYQCYHANHHRFTGDPNRDPELTDSLIDLKIDSIFSYVLYLSGVPFWVDRTTTLLRHGWGWFLPRERLFLCDRTSIEVMWEARVYLALYVAIFYALAGDEAIVLRNAVVCGWVLPTVVAQNFLRLYLIAEHVGCAQGADMLSNTRTTNTFSWYRWLAWNMPYHAEHHAFPFVPFHQLPELHARLSRECPFYGHLQSRCTPHGDDGYLGVNLRLVKSLVRASPLSRVI